MKMKKYITTRPVGGIRDNAGTGFVVIPKDQDINSFIESCFRTGSISLLLENGGVINNVLLSKKEIGEIEFPDSYDSFGSQLVWINLPKKNQPIVIGSISKTNEFTSFSKNKSSLRRVTKGFVNEIVVDSEKGCIIINSNSSKETGGDIYIISTNKEKNSSLNIIVSGDINIRSKNTIIENSKKTSFIIKDKNIDENITEISYEKTIGFSYRDEFKNEAYLNNDNIQFKPNSKFNIGGGREPITLANSLGDLLDEFITQVSIATVTTLMGPMPLLNASAISALKNKINTIKSKLSNTD